MKKIFNRIFGRKKDQLDSDENNYTLTETNKKALAYEIAWLYLLTVVNYVESKAIIRTFKELCKIYKVHINEALELAIMNRDSETVFSNVGYQMYKTDPKCSKYFEICCNIFVDKINNNGLELKEIIIPLNLPDAISSMPTQTEAEFSAFIFAIHNHIYRGLPYALFKRMYPNDEYYV